MLLRASAAAVAAVTVAGCGGVATAKTAPAPHGEVVQVVLADFSITPARAVSKTGAFTFAIDNRGRSPHNLTVEDQSGKLVVHTADLKPGQSTAVSVRLPAGSYSTFCSLPGHASLGMKGTLAVGDSGP
ncbi:cupredoxin domain-containing protein [Candidatus Nephthysia bennettiae]|uniref:Cupredoxin domain-containing protein n=1 Tax=Candidatus Nephthysia bennettiae TaxID=3127016 RepID=A0A934NFA4_9BACT|nr:cupredoxin domain-containing protein [Candidatus Dormibacteraeota bacterium]